MSENRNSEVFTVTLSGGWWDCQAREKVTSQSVYLRVDEIDGEWEVRVCGDQHNGPNLSYDHGYVRGYRINKTGRYRLMNYVHETNHRYCYLAFHPLSGGERTIRFCWSPGSRSDYPKPEPISFEEPTFEELTLGERIVEKARSKLKCPYTYGGTGPDTFDCSGFTQWVYAQFGIQIPRGAKEQAQRGKNSSGRPGELVFFGSDIRHTGICIGNGECIHASKPGDVVKITKIQYFNEPYTFRNYGTS